GRLALAPRGRGLRRRPRDDPPPPATSSELEVEAEDCSAFLDECRIAAPVERGERGRDVEIVLQREEEHMPGVLELESRVVDEQLPLVEVPVRSVVLAEEEPPHGLRGVSLEELLDRDQIAERLAHLLAVEPDVPRVHPVTDERFVGDRLGLRELALVMREYEVDTAAVDVEWLAEKASRHGRAFDMPARPPRSPGALPRGFAWLAPLPQHEIEWVVLVRVVGPAAALRRELQHLLG